MKIGFKRVPAIDKCFGILKHLAKSKDPLGISEISKALNYNRSTVFNMVHTLTDLEILEQRGQAKFHFGTQLYLLGRAGSRSSDLIGMVHPYLEEINQETKLSAFLGIRSGDSAVILDKADSAFDIKIHSEVGMRIPLLAGAGGIVLLSQMSDDEIDKILSKKELRKFTRFSCVNKERYKKRIKRVRIEGIAVDKEEYIEGIRAFAVPLRISSGDSPVAIWAIGLKRQITDERIDPYSEFLKGIAKEIESQLDLI